MIDKVTLRLNAEIRLKDAQVLLAHGQLDGAAYLCGYAVEFALKARICDTLNTGEYLDYLQSYKTHDLERLLFLTGQEAPLKQNVLVEWTSVVHNWKPEMRYKKGFLSTGDVQTLLNAAQVLLQHL